MSYPYPQDRHRDRREKGEHPYKDAKEALSREQAELQEQAEAYGESHLRSQEEREADAAERLAAVNDEMQRQRADR